MARPLARGFAGELLALGFFLLSNLLGVVLVHDARYIRARFSKWRHTPILLNPLRTSVISSQSFDEIEIIKLKQFPQIAAPARNICLRIESIVHAQLIGGAGHELHQSTRAFRRNRMRIESTFSVNNAVHEVGVQMISCTGGV